MQLYSTEKNAGIKRKRLDFIGMKTESELQSKKVKASFKENEKIQNILSLNNIPKYLDAYMNTFFNRDYDAFLNFLKTGSGEEHRKYVVDFFKPSVELISLTDNYPTLSGLCSYVRKRTTLHKIMNGPENYKLVYRSEDDSTLCTKKGIVAWRNGKKNGRENYKVWEMESNGANLQVIDHTLNWKDSLLSGIEKYVEVRRIDHWVWDVMEEDNVYENTQDIIYWKDDEYGQKVVTQWKNGLKEGLELISTKDTTMQDCITFESNEWKDGLRHGKSILLIFNFKDNNGKGVSYETTTWNKGEKLEETAFFLNHEMLQLKYYKFAAENAVKSLKVLSMDERRRSTENVCTYTETDYRQNQEIEKNNIYILNCPTDPQCKNNSLLNSYSEKFIKTRQIYHRNGSMISADYKCNGSFTGKFSYFFVKEFISRKTDVQNNGTNGKYSSESSKLFEKEISRVDVLANLVVILRNNPYFFESVKDMLLEYTSFPSKKGDLSSQYCKDHNGVKYSLCNDVPFICQERCKIGEYFETEMGDISSVQDFILKIEKRYEVEKETYIETEYYNNVLKTVKSETAYTFETVVYRKFWSDDGAITNSLSSSPGYSMLENTVNIYGTLAMEEFFNINQNKVTRKFYKNISDSENPTSIVNVCCKIISGTKEFFKITEYLTKQELEAMQYGDTINCMITSDQSGKLNYKLEFVCYNIDSPYKRDVINYTYKLSMKIQNKYGFHDIKTYDTFSNLMRISIHQIYSKPGSTQNELIGAYNYDEDSIYPISKPPSQKEWQTRNARDSPVKEQQKKITHHTYTYEGFEDISKIVENFEDVLKVGYQINLEYEAKNCEDDITRQEDLPINRTRRYNIPSNILTFTPVSVKLYSMRGNELYWCYETRRNNDQKYDSIMYDLLAFKKSVYQFNNKTIQFKTLDVQNELGEGLKKLNLRSSSLLKDVPRNIATVSLRHSFNHSFGI